MLLGLLGSNDTTGGNCWICYSHSSYFAEVPEKHTRDESGKISIDEKGNYQEKYKDYREIWGEPKTSYDNKSLPYLGKPTNKNHEGVYDEKQI